MPRIETGLYDSDQQPICVGDLLKLEVTSNTDLHGSYSVYEVIQPGVIPLMSYLYSEKGQVVPKGKAGGPLNNMYDPNLLSMGGHNLRLAPDEYMVVFKE